MPGERQIVTSPEAIGPVLARVRRTRRWSQADFADQLARTSGMATVTRHEVSRWERGERVPSAYWLRWIAAVTAEPLADLEQAAAVSRALRGRMHVPGLLLPEIAPNADLSGRLKAIASAPERVDDPAVDWLTLCLSWLDGCRRGRPRGRGRLVRQGRGMGSRVWKCRHGGNCVEYAGASGVGTG